MGSNNQCSERINYHYNLAPQDILHRIQKGDFQLGIKKDTSPTVFDTALYSDPQQLILRLQSEPIERAADIIIMVNKIGKEEARLNGDQTRWCIYGAVSNEKQDIERFYGKTLMSLTPEKGDITSLRDVIRHVADEVVRKYFIPDKQLADADPSKKILEQLASNARKKYDDGVRSLKNRYSVDQPTHDDLFTLVLDNDLWAVDLASLILADNQILSEFSEAEIASAFYDSISKYKSNCEQKAMSRSIPQGDLNRVVNIRSNIVFLENL